mgnify:CR=1 FL=1
MTKRQIIKWLESQSEKALAEVETQSEKALNTYYAERNERIGLEDTATSIAALMQQAYSLTESFKEKVKAEYPGVDTLCGYYGSISYKLANMSSQAEIRSCLLKEFEDGRTEIRKGIKARKNEMIKGNAEGKTRAKSLYDNYKMWCKGNGYYVCSMKKFNAELTAHPEWYADKAVTQGVLFYYGVALRQN